MKRKTLSWNKKRDREKLVEIIQAGGVALGPSDTVLGLLVSATRQGVERLNTIKQRVEKPYIILVDSIEKLSRYVELPHSDSVRALMQQCWPGPITLLLPARPYNEVYPHAHKIAVRIPYHKELLDVLSHVDGCLSTSANKAGESVPHDMQDVDPDIIKQVACIVTDEGEHKKLPSTILDCVEEGIRVVREGAYPIADLERIADTKFLKS